MGQVWGNWVCSASTREGSEETLLLLTAISLEDAEEMEPDSSQRCTLIAEKAIDVSGNIGNSNQILGFFLFIIVMIKCCKRVGDVQDLAAMAGSNLICSGLALTRGLAQLTSGSPSNLNHFMIL